MQRCKIHVIKEKHIPRGWRFDERQSWLTREALSETHTYPSSWHGDWPGRPGKRILPSKGPLSPETAKATPWILSWSRSQRARSCWAISWSANCESLKQRSAIIAKKHLFLDWLSRKKSLGLKLSNRCSMLYIKRQIFFEGRVYYHQWWIIVHLKKRIPRIRIKCYMHIVNSSHSCQMIV